MDRISTLLEFLEADPKDAFTRFALAQEYRKAGRAEEALAVFEALVEDQPSYVGTYYHLGALYESLGRTDAALATYRTGVRVATEAGATHDRAELQSALMAAEGLGFD